MKATWWWLCLGLACAGCQCGEELTQSRCSPVTCSGCCTIDGTCVTGDGDGACGGEGQSCLVCGESQRCRAAVCTLELPPPVSEPDAGVVPTRDAGPEAMSCGAPEEPPSSCLATGWCWQSPFPTGVPLTSVTALAEDDVWVTGAWGTALHFDGARWRSERVGSFDTVQGVARSRGRLFMLTEPTTERNGFITLRRKDADGGWVIAYTLPGSNSFSRTTGDLVGDDAGVGFWTYNTEWKTDGVTFDAVSLSERCLSDQVCGARFARRSTASAQEGFAVGSLGYIARLKSGNWFQIAGGPLPDAGRQEGVVGVTPLPDGGWFFLDQYGRTRGWSGTSLVEGTALPPPIAVNPSQPARGAYVHSFAIGDQVNVTGEPGELFRATGAGWEQVTLNTHRKYLASAARTPTDVWLAGDGSLEHFDGRRWEQQFRNVIDETLNDIDITAQTGFAVGEGGVVLRRKGSTWTRVNIGVSVDLTGVVAFDCDLAIVVGARGTIVMWDGVTWRLVSSGVTDDLFGVFALSRTDVWAVGANGTILSFDGQRWKRESVPTTRNLAAIWGPDRGNLFAVGEEGTIVRFDGTRWALDPAVGTALSFTDVHGTSANRVFAAGRTAQGSAPARLWDGTTWQNVVGGGSSVLATQSSYYLASQGGVLRGGVVGATLDVPGSFNRVIFAQGQLWAVGSRGTILSKRLAP